MTHTTTGDGVVLRLPAEMQKPDVPAAVTVARVGPTGIGTADPVVTVTDGGRTAVHTNCTGEDVADIAAAVSREGLPADGADAVLDHEPDTTEFPAPIPELPGFEHGRQVLAGCGWRRPTDPEDHAAAGGFADVGTAAVWDAAGAVVGRGWGDRSQDAPLDPTWEVAREAAGSAVVVVNAHGSPPDALLLESVPFEVLEGASAAARAVGADAVLVYASAADGRALSRAREAVEAYPDPAAPMDVVEGPPEYRAAEPTMALEAIEGNHRLEARLRPPGPEEVGLHGRPTLVHTARTLAHLAVGLRADGTDSRLVTVTGEVDAPATVELSGSELRTALPAAGVDGFKAACVGGRFGGLTASLDVAPGPEALTDAGLGTGGTVEILGEGECVVDFVARRAAFASAENCGRCVPCREGTTQLAELLEDVSDGADERAKIAELQRVMRTTSICDFGVNAGRPARTAMEAFETEFEAHAGGECPAGVCTREVVA